MQVLKRLKGIRTKFVLVVVAIVGQGMGAFLLDSAAERAVLVLGLAMALIWGGAQVALFEERVRTGESPEARRFLKLRGQVDLLLTDIRRLNWLAVDERLGFQDPIPAQQEIDDTYDRLMHSVGMIHRYAGQESSRSLGAAVGEEQDRSVTSAEADPRGPMA